MFQHREPTKIEVTTIQAEGLEAQALAFRRKSDSTVTGMRLGFASHGFVETPKGIFAFCSEGVGRALPITDSAPYELEFYAEWPGDEPGLTSQEAIPSVTIALTPAELRERAGKQVNLGEFIRTFGARLDGNYAAWKTALEKAMRSHRREKEASHEG